MAIAQTDKSLWYTGTESSPDDNYSTHCYGAIPIGHYYTIDGTRGTTYACLAPPEEDEITPAELAAISRYAQRLNSIGKKSLNDHQEAIYLKNLAQSLVNRP